MENQNPPDAMDRLSDLPEPILHRILYFLTNKEAARTCVLSKSWRHIWSNRHKLCLSELRFKGNKKDFIFQANNTLQSLLDQNHQGIREFQLTISTLDSQSLAFLHKWLPMLAAIPIKHLYLHILPNEKESVEFDLPLEAFAAKSLRNLHLNRCNLLSLYNKQLVNIPFKHNLTILRLRRVSVNEQHINEIISGCKNLTTMLFEQCQGLTHLKILNHHKNLRHFTIIAHESYRTRDCSIEIDLPTIETIKIVGRSTVLLHNREYSKLKSLSLDTVVISRDSFEKSSSCSFPNLEDLTLIHYVFGGLPCIHIDAPNIVKFQCVGNRIPSLSFTPTCRKWSSDITLRHIVDAQSWFLNLSKLLHSLSHSEITLRIRLHIPQHPPLALAEEDIDNSSKPPVAVESLQLGGDVPSKSLLDGLFCICRPRYIAQYWYLKPSNEMMRVEQKELIEFLCSLLMNTNQQEEDTRQHHHHLPSDVKLQSFDSGRGEWQFTDQNSLTKLASMNTQTFRHIRFLLNWSQDC